MFGILWFSGPLKDEIRLFLNSQFWWFSLWKLFECEGYNFQTHIRANFWVHNVMHFPNEPSFAIILKKCQSFLNGLCAQCQNCLCSALSFHTALKIISIMRIAQKHTGISYWKGLDFCFWGAGNLNLKHGVVCEFEKCILFCRLLIMENWQANLENMLMVDT